MTLKKSAKKNTLKKQVKKQQKEKLFNVSYGENFVVLAKNETDAKSILADELINCIAQGQSYALFDKENILSNCFVTDVIDMDDIPKVYKKEAFPIENILKNDRNLRSIKEILGGLDFTIENNSSIKLDGTFFEEDFKDLCDSYGIKCKVKVEISK